MSTLLDTIITLAFVFTLLSILVTYITEAYQRIIKSRGKLLKSALDKLLNDPINKNYSELLYEHPLVRGFRINEKHLPSYISTALFIDALLDLIRREAGEPHIFMTTDGKMHVTEVPKMEMFESVRAGIEAMAHSPFRVRLASMMDNSTDLNSYRKVLEVWYHEYQDGITSQFRDKARIRTFIISFFVAIVMNVDSISLFKNVYSDHQLREVIVAEAISWSNNNPVLPISSYTESTNLQSEPEVDTRQELLGVAQRIDSLKRYFVDHNLPIGWNCPNCCAKEMVSFFKELATCISERWGDKSSTDRLTIIIGWLFTTLALSFGAPFWFDLLNKLTALRTGKPKPGSVNALTKTKDHE